MKASFTTLATALSLGATLVQAAPAEKRDNKVTPITVKGNAFFKGDERFYMRGVDYQPGGSSKLYVYPSSAANSLSDWCRRTA